MALNWTRTGCRTTGLGSFRDAVRSTYNHPALSEWKSWMNEKRENTLKQKHKILVVDDEKMIRWSLGEALRGWGFEPVEAETVSAALAAFEADTPTAVLLDINL